MGKQQSHRQSVLFPQEMREAIEKHGVEPGQSFQSIVRLLVSRGIEASESDRVGSQEVLAAIAQLPTLEQIEATVAGADSRAECAIAFIRALWEGEEPEVACVLRIANALEVDPQEFREWMRGIIASRADRASRSE